MNTSSGKYWDASFSPITGCSPLFDCWWRCWARAMCNRLPQLHGDKFDVPRFHPDRKVPGGKNKWVAVNWLGDMFAYGVEDEWIAHVFDTMDAHPEHQFLVLTKRPERMRDFLNDFWLPSANVWLGVSASDEDKYRVRLPPLLETRAVHRWLSLEPLHSPIYPGFLTGPAEIPSLDIDWIVAGAELGPGAHPARRIWFEWLRDFCIDHGIPFWLKSLGPGKGRELDGRTWNERPEIEPWQNLTKN